jgi:predicted HTH transcriptional regulator
MSIFAKPASSVSAADLEQLLTDSSVENLRLEFKREIPSKDETLKKVTSFANTMGGLVVVGAEAGGDGRIVALPGVDAKPGYKQTIVQWCFDGVSPPLDIDVSEPLPVAGASGRVCYVIAVAESELAPHFLNGRKGVYVRTNEFSSRFDAQLANENELRHLAQRRQLVRERRVTLSPQSPDPLAHCSLGRRTRTSPPRTCKTTSARRDGLRSRSGHPSPTRRR